MITEAFPEDSGLFKCVALNSFGSVSCSATLDVYNGTKLNVHHLFLYCWSHIPVVTFTPGADLEEELEYEAVQQQQEEGNSHRQEKVKDSPPESSEDFPPELPNLMNLPPPEWPDSPLEDNSFAE